MSKVLDLVDRRPVVFFLLPFVIYMLNFREISNGDPTPTVFIAISLLTDGDLYLEELRGYIPYNKMPYYLSEHRGRILSNYPVMPGILAVPVFLPAVWFDLIRPEAGDLSWRLFSKMAGSIFTSLSVLVLFLTLRRVTTTAGAMWAALAYAFGTASWPISSQSLWQHGPSCLMWMLCLYGLVRAGEASAADSLQTAWLALAGVASGLAVCCRLVSLGPLLLVLLAVAVVWRVRGLAWYGVSFLLPVVLLFCYNYYFFGTWNGGLSEVLDLRWYLDRVEGGIWETPLLVGCAGNLISPSRGLLVFSPFLIFSGWGMVRVWREEGHRWRLFRALVLIPLVFLVIFGKYTVWWGGNAHYGPRYQIEMLPVLMFFFGLGWTLFSRRRWLVILFALLLVYAVFVQWIGAFCYPSDWTSEPVDISIDKGRYWNLSYNQIVTCLRSGIKPRLF